MDNEFDGGWHFGNDDDAPATPRKGKVHRATYGGDVLCAAGKAYDDNRALLTTYDDDKVTCKTCLRHLGK